MGATASAKKKTSLEQVFVEQDLARTSLGTKDLAQKAWHKRKEPCPGQGSFHSWFVQSYLRLDEIELNLAFNVEPRLLTTVMIASAIPAAIRPYSMAVAPDSSFAKFATRFFIKSSK